MNEEAIQMVMSEQKDTSRDTGAYRQKDTRWLSYLSNKKPMK